MERLFLIHPDVKETRPTEDVGHLADKVAADLIVGGRRHATRIWPQPDVVGGGEVELGDRFETSPPRPRHFTLQPVHTPRPFHRDLRVRLVADRVREVNDHHVEAGVRHAFQEVAPEARVTSPIRAVREVRAVRQMIGQRLVTVVVQIVAEVQQAGPDKPG